MSCFLINSSIGKKLVMALSGVALVLFILFHMSMNLVAIFSAEAYNAICAFLGANWYALAATAVLGAGVVVHIVYALILTKDNYAARGTQRYSITTQERGVTWASKNMLVLGYIILIGLGLHLFNFWAKMQLVEILHFGSNVPHHDIVNSVGLHPTDGAALIKYTFSCPAYVVAYLVWFFAIWFHLTHGVWSMFQTTGMANDTWYPRLKCIANAVATLVFLGFAAVVVYTYVASLLCSTCC